MAARRFRYRLSTLLIVITVIALAAGAIGLWRNGTWTDVPFITVPEFLQQIEEGNVAKVRLTDEEARGTFKKIPDSLNSRRFRVVLVGLTGEEFSRHLVTLLRKRDVEVETVGDRLTAP